MILVDTCVIIDYLRTPTPEIKNIFKKNEIATCGVVMAEILRGASSEKQFNQLKKAMECFEYIPFEQSDWESLSMLLYTLKSSGISVPFQDAMIALLAIKADCSLWTTDRHFSILQSVLPELKLFQRIRSR